MQLGISMSDSIGPEEDMAVVINGIVAVENKLFKIAGSTGGGEEADTARKDAVRLHQRLIPVHATLVNRMFNSTTLHYDKSINALRDVNNQIQSGLDSLNDIVNFINAATALVSALEELAAAVAPA